MSSASFSVRSATPADSPAIGEVNVAAWNAIYRGTLADATLDGLDPAGKAAEWRTYIASEMSPLERMWVVLDDSEDVVGYSRTGPVRDKDLDPEYTAEVYGLYVHPDHWSTGAGRELFAWVVEDFIDRAFSEASLWVVEVNARARSFYERNGWRLDPGPTNTCFGAPEVRYRKRLSRARR
ncbi:MAG: GNAT family N-acetyltransferase [Actinomycetota bacterium]